MLDWKLPASQSPALIPSPCTSRGVHLGATCRSPAGDGTVLSPCLACSRLPSQLGEHKICFTSNVATSGETAKSPLAYPKSHSFSEQTLSSDRGVSHDSYLPGTMMLVSGDSAFQFGGDEGREEPQEREKTWQLGGHSGLF